MSVVIRASLCEGCGWPGSRRVVRVGSREARRGEKQDEEWKTERQEGRGKDEGNEKDRTRGKSEQEVDGRRTKKERQRDRKEEGKMRGK